MFRKRLVTSDAQLRTSRLAINPLRKETPRNRLRNDDANTNRRRKLADEPPPILTLHKAPPASTIAGNLNKRRSTHRSIHITKRMWQPAQERIKNGIVKGPCHDAGPSCRQTNLLLMMPPLRKFTRVVEPHARRHLSRPRDTDRRRSKRIQRLTEIRSLHADNLHQLRQNTRTKSSINSNAFLIQAIHQHDNILRRKYVDPFHAALVAPTRKLSQRSIEQMRSHIANTPLGRNSGQLPFRGSKRGK